VEYNNLLYRMHLQLSVLSKRLWTLGLLERPSIKTHKQKSPSSFCFWFSFSELLLVNLFPLQVKALGNTLLFFQVRITIIRYHPNQHSPQHPHQYNILHILQFPLIILYQHFHIKFVKNLLE